MKTREFSTDIWIDKLGKALSHLAKTQEPYLDEHCRQAPRGYDMREGESGISPDSLLNDLRDMYSMAYFGRGLAETYRPLTEALDPVRYALMSHPSIERVVGQTIGRDDFWVQIPDSGSLTSLTDVVAGLIARATQLSGDCFHAVAGELNSLLTLGADIGPSELPTGLNHGIDAVLFWGLDVTEPVQIETGMTILPFNSLKTFLDKNQVEKLAPPGAMFHDFRSVGAVVQSFRWDPQLCRTRHSKQPVLRNPSLFFNASITFVDVLSVAHSTPVIPIATFANCTNRSESLLLGRTQESRSYSNVRSAQAFDGFEVCPRLTAEAVNLAREVLSTEGRRQFRNYVPVLARLCEALATQGPFAATTRFVPLAVALEQMYDIRKNDSSRKLQDRVSMLLGIDSHSREMLKRNVKKFYDERSASVHNRQEKTTQRKNQEAFDAGFDIAKRTFFKLLKEGSPVDWGRMQTNSEVTLRR